ncbi:MAG TPA: response regulator transcription factor [Opitutaceae bacterium]
MVHQITHDHSQTDTSQSDHETTTKRRIFLVDDHPVTRQGVATLIDQEDDLMVCGEAESAPVAFEKINKLKPDLVVADVTLKVGNGLELVKNLRAAVPEVRVLVISMHDERLYAERALRAGALGYVMKQEASDKILLAIRRVLSGELFLSDRVKEKMVYRLVAMKPEAAKFPIDTLSDREMEVFKLLGNGYSTRQIAAQLNLSVKTIDSYREHLKIKLRLPDGASLVQHAIQWMRTEQTL